MGGWYDVRIATVLQRAFPWIDAQLRKRRVRLALIDVRRHRGKGVLRGRPSLLIYAR